MERVELRTPPQYRIENIDRHGTLDAMLRTGEIDAIMSPQIPDSFNSGDGQVKRLFAEHRAEEAAYFVRTSIFPIMHLLVIRKEQHERDLDLALKLLNAFEEAKLQSFKRLYDGDALYVRLTWLISEIEATMEVMGTDFWPYGVEKNRHVPCAFVAHLRSQGLTEEQLDKDALFARQVLAT